jgi:WD40 repeat protein
VTSAAVSPDGRRVVSGSSDKTVAVWDLESGTLIHQLLGHQSGVTSVAVSPDGRHVVSGSYDKTVEVWDLETGRRLATLTLDGGTLTVAWHPDGRVIVAGDTGSNLYRMEYREP